MVGTLPVEGGGGAAAMEETEGDEIVSWAARGVAWGVKRYVPSLELPNACKTPLTRRSAEHFPEKVPPGPTFTLL
jgi:hypothetical protein